MTNGIRPIWTKILEAVGDKVPASFRVLEFCRGIFDPAYAADLPAAEYGFQPLSGFEPYTEWDAVVAVNVLDSIVDDDEYQAAITKMADALKPGGVLVVVGRIPEEDPPAGSLPRGYFAVLEHVAFANLEGTRIEGADEWIGGFWKRDCPGYGVPSGSELGPEGSIVEPLPLEIDNGKLVGDAPDVIAVTRELLDSAAPEFLERDRDTVRIRLADADPLTYRVIGWQGRGERAICRRVR